MISLRKKILSKISSAARIQLIMGTLIEIDLENYY